MRERTIKPITAGSRNNFGLLAFCAIFTLSGCGRNFATLSEKGRKSYAEKNYTDAADAFTLALSRWTKDDGLDKKSDAYFLLGKSYDGLRKLDKTIEAYTDAVESYDKAFEPAYELGRIYLTTNEYDNALRAFQTALRIKENDPLSLLGVANSYYGLKKIKEAKAAYERVLDVSPGVRNALEALDLIRHKPSSPKVHAKAVPAKAVPAKAANGKKAGSPRKNINYKVKKKPRK